ncbi:MnhB domain-containing protein [Streptomyces sp. NPDC001514]
MSRTLRIRLFCAAAALFAAAWALACLDLPDFGGAEHPYGERAVAASLRQQTANAVASLVFDQRAFDTLGEEFILFAAVVGATVLLRPARDERSARPRPADVQPSVRLVGTVMLPVALLTGGYIVAHGQLSPGGGFQGGVVLATGLHVAYVAADYRVLKRVRPLAVLDVADAIAAGAFAALGLAGLFAAAAYLENVLPHGAFGSLASGGLVPLVNAAVGVEVGSGLVVLLAGFIDQAVEIETPGDGG